MEYFEVAVRVVEAKQFPNVAEAFSAIGSVPPTSSVSDFEFGLATILDGIEALDATGERSQHFGIGRCEEVN